MKAPALSSTAARVNGRLVSVDLLRGIVMVVMALDHTRGYFSEADFDPADLNKTSVALFLTRWITHFCAPVFVFLAGTGAYFSSLHAENKAILARFLLTRGFWLIFLQSAVEPFAWSFTPDYTQIGGGVLWAIGWSMMVLAALIFLPLALTATFGIALIALHNLFDAVRPEALGLFGPVWAVLHTGDTVKLADSLSILPYYPLVPWIGVMATGFAFGRLLHLDRKLQEKLIASLGVVMVTVFVVLRYSNVYGDPTPWSIQDRSGFTLLSFLNCEKYPPSLLYLLMTLGPAIAVLPWLDRIRGRVGAFFMAFGRVPLFYYLLHLFFIHLLAVVLAWLTGGPAIALLDEPWEYPGSYGYGLPVVYLLWAFVVMALYPVCRWYAGIKSRQPRKRWLRYL